MNRRNRIKELKRILRPVLLVIAVGSLIIIVMPIINNPEISPITKFLVYAGGLIGFVWLIFKL